MVALPFFRHRGDTSPITRTTSLSTGWWTDTTGELVCLGTHVDSDPGIFPRIEQAYANLATELIRLGFTNRDGEATLRVPASMAGPFLRDEAVRDTLCPIRDDGLISVLYGACRLDGDQVMLEITAGAGETYYLHFPGHPDTSHGPEQGAAGWYTFRSGALVSHARV